MTKDYTQDFNKISEAVARKATTAADNLERNARKIFKNGKTKLI